MSIEIVVMSNSTIHTAVDFSDPVTHSDTDVLIKKKKSDKKQDKLNNKAIQLANNKAEIKQEYKEIVKAIAVNINQNKIFKKYNKRFYYNLQYGSGSKNKQAYCETRCIKLKIMFDINGFKTKMEHIRINAASFYELIIDYTDLTECSKSDAMTIVQRRINKMNSKI
jgi:hypothetical protein